MTEFDIRRAVRAVIEETDLASPEEIATKVAENVPSKLLRPVLATVMREYVRVELSRIRMDLTRASRTESQPPAHTRSAKVTAIRSAAPGWLRDRVFVGDSTWKLLGECTYENLRYLETERIENAARSTAAAQRYARLAELLRKHKAATVADLPKRVLDSDEWQAAA